MCMSSRQQRKPPITSLFTKLFFFFLKGGISCFLSWVYLLRVLGSVLRRRKRRARLGLLLDSWLQTQCC
jgi:hypothetical protein